MKLALVTLSLVSQLAQADTPALPPNPFQNIPNDSANFDPFADDFDEHGFDDDAPQAAPGINRGGMPGAQGGARSGTAKPRPEMAGNNGGGTQAPRPGAKNGIDPATCKEVVESFDYPDSEILDVAKAISKLMGKNFIYNPQDIKGRISIVSNTSITVCDAYNAFLAALNVKGFALVPSGKYLRIERVGSAKEKQTPIYSDKGAPVNEEFITRVVPLRYIDATEVEQTFRMWMPREARLQAYAQTNTLIVTDTATHISRMMELISLLDVAGYQESLAVIQIRNAAAKDLAKIIEQIISEGKSNQTSRFGSAPRPTPTFGSSLRPGGANGRQGGMQISKIIADDRTNTLIVKANAVGINEVKALIHKLDTKVSPTEGSGRIHVVRLQFASAEEIAKTMGSITQNATKSNPVSRFGGFSPLDNTPNNAQVFQGEIKISADKFTQSLVITASPQDFATLKKVIETLDVPRDQVFVESIIMEVAMGRNSSFGTSFVSTPNGIALPNGADGSLATMLGGGNPLGLGGLVLGFKSGANRAFTLGSGDAAKTFHVNTVNGMVDLIMANTDSNIVAKPQLIALDNQASEITIGDEIPEQQGASTANGVTTSGGFNTKKADLHLKVTPQINKGSDFVKLDIEQKLENFNGALVPEKLQGQALGKSTRETKTSVIVENEDTVVISGLIRDSINESVRKVPILGDIPLLGWLFKNKKTESSKTNLIVFITPKIVKQYDAVRKILEDRLHKREKFVEHSLGSVDPMRAEVDDIRKSLPDINKLSPLPESHTIEAKSFSAPSAPSDGDQESGDYEPWNEPSNQPYITPPMETQPAPIDNSAPPPVMPGDTAGGYQ